ncbi:Fibrinogen C-terminal domain-containing protein [Aphelenchoides bicaudatus]|nr:Fibrinogen C-terminal domain-containing protein [Aphelenchoides bicaudatus]
MPRYYDTLDKHMDSAEIDPCMAAQIRLKKRKKIGPKMIAFGAILLILLVVGILVVCAIFLLPSLLSQTHQSPDKSSTENQTLNEGSDHSSDSFSEPVPSTTRQIQYVPKIRPFVDYDTSISAKAATEINTYGTYSETCDDYFRNGFTQSGIYRLQRPGHYDFKTQCEMNVDGDNQAWMVMQKRTGNTVMFWNRTMEEYAQGFGDIFTNYWLGLRNVRHLIEAGHRLQLKMQVEGERCVGRSAYYVGIWRFEIGSELEGFRLGVSRILQGNFHRFFGKYRE